jgi:tRNA modification GTPase
MPERKRPIELGTARGGYPLSRFAYAACATPPGVGGIAVIRMSGRDSFVIANEIFKSESPAYEDIFVIPGYSCAYGSIINPATGDVLDKVILTKFISPGSYTGEDTIEISCHGGLGTKNSILAALYDCGARPAEPGEFTKNAFLNGKIDLSQAEAVIDLISSNAKMASMQALKHLEGNLSIKIREISSLIYELLSRVEMIIEFPEHEESDESSALITESLNIISVKLNALIATFAQGRILSEGFTVAITGKPNAGKSSMLNTLSGYNRAIVTDIPGTTRDTVEEIVDIEGLPVRLIDTAGLRQSDDEVEKLGIDRAREAIESADLVLWICGDAKLDINNLYTQDEDFKYLLSSRLDRNLTLIIGKSDIIPYEKNRELLHEVFPEVNILPFSSVTGEGVDDVRKLILRHYEESGAAGSMEIVITNARHRHAIVKSEESLEMAQNAYNEGLPLDIISAALRSSAEHLAQITGDEVSEEIVNEIFSRFCIGK